MKNLIKYLASVFHIGGTLFAHYRRKRELKIGLLNYKHKGRHNITYRIAPVHISTKVQPKLQASNSEEIPFPSSQKMFKEDFLSGSQDSGAV